MSAGRRARALAGALAAALAAPALAAPAAPAPLPGSGSCRGCNLIVVSLDTLRPDRLETYGYAKPTSPNLAAFSRGALVFDRAYSAAGVTAESHMSLFTSLYSSVHGVARARPVRPLGAGIPVLAELLSQRGYATAGFHGGGNVSPEFGFDRGFDTYTQARIADAADFSAVRAWLSEPREGPVFLFLHTYHAHDPYLPGAELRERFAPGYTGAIVSDRQALQREAEAHCAGRPGCDAWRESHRLYWSRVDRRDPRDLAHVSGLYDAQIRELDTAVLRVLLAIRELPGDTLVVMLSDHGEAFGEHGELMHATLHEEITRVPLLVRHPRAKHTWGRRVEQAVSLVDVAPSLLDWLGVGVPATFQGRALSSAPASPAAHGAAPDPRDILSEFAQRGELALVRGSRKILLRTAGGPLPERARRVLARVAAELGLAADAQRFRQIELFDLDADPGELFDLGPAHPDFEPMLRAALSRVRSNRAHRAGLAVVEAPSVELPDQTLRQLEALGYLD